MLKRIFVAAEGGGFLKKGIASTAFMTSGFVWYLYLISFLAEFATVNGYEDSLWIILGLNIFVLAVCAFAGTLMMRYVEKRIRFLRGWSLVGVPVSLALLGIGIGGLGPLLLVALFMGAYFGFGMPVSMAYYAASTEPENRARIGGIAFLTIFVSVILLGAVAGSSVLIAALLLAGVKAVSYAGAAFLKVYRDEPTKESNVSFRVVLSDRGFQLYFIPWIMFGVVNYLARPMTETLFSGNFLEYSTLIANLLSGLFAVVCGFYGDYVGRKRLTIAAFTLLGLGYACLGLFPGAVLGWWFYSFVDGIAWGAFYTIFVMTIWGDLAKGKRSEKYYLLGSLPFLLSLFMQFGFANLITSTLAATAIFSFASIFLFVAVLPLAYAPETLEKSLKRRELENYVKQAQRAKVIVDSN